MWTPNTVGLAMLDPDDEMEKIREFRDKHGRLPTDREMAYWRVHDVTVPIQPATEITTGVWWDYP